MNDKSSAVEAADSQIERGVLWVVVLVPCWDVGAVCFLWAPTWYMGPLLGIWRRKGVYIYMCIYTYVQKAREREREREIEIEIESKGSPGIGGPCSVP